MVGQGLHHTSLHTQAQETRQCLLFSLPFCCVLVMVGFVEFLGDKLAGKDGKVATEIALTRRTAVALYSVRMVSTLPPVPATNRRVVQDRFAVEGFEFVFISGDKDEKTFVEYIGEIP